MVSKSFSEQNNDENILNINKSLSYGNLEKSLYVDSHPTSNT